MSGGKAVLLVGSPRCERSNSYAIGSFLLDRLQEQGIHTDSLFLSRLAAHGGIEKLLAVIEDVDIIIFASPLYVDSLPSSVIRTFEQVRENRTERQSYKKQRFIAILNSGFPEPSQSRVAIDICRRMAIECGMTWEGGITVGMGTAIGSQPLEKTGGVTSSLRKGLRLVSASLVADVPVQGDALSLASKPFVPLFVARMMLVLMGRRSWHSQVAEKIVLQKMKDRPYESKD